MSQFPSSLADPPPIYSPSGLGFGEFMENDQRIKESILNCPNKMLRRHLWTVLGGYCWRRSRLVSWCRARLPIVFYPSGDSSTHQKYINLIYNLCLVQFKSHTISFWCFRWKVLNLYTSYTDKIPIFST
jgi:hypothetical protein